MMDDSTLLRRYAEDRSESDFAELVHRHLNLVYSAALRQVNGDAHLAQDVTQLVFSDLARKAAQLAGHRVLAGWLFTSTRFAAAKLVRGEQRRRAREQETEPMQESDPMARLDWERVRPVLDEALAELSEQDREAVLLRYMEGRDFAQVGAKLALSDNAARMRVDRAVDRLRGLLARRGVRSTAAALSLALANEAVVAAPTGLAATVTGAALAGTGTAATLTFMSLTKLQLSFAGAVVATGAGVFAVQENETATLREELAALHESNRTAAAAAATQPDRDASKATPSFAELEVTDEELVRLRDEALTLQRQLQAAATPKVRSAAKPAGAALPIKHLDLLPRPLVRKAPRYPAELRAAGIEGSVVVSMVIDLTGKVIQARVEQSTHADFELAALEAVREWQFEPGLKGGRAVNTRVSQKLEFKPDGAAQPPLTVATDQGNNPPSDWF